MILDKKYNWIYFSLGAIILLIPALSNNYPFVYSDTGAYINTGFTNTVPNDRPIFYGWFLRHVSLRQTFWLPVFLQSLMIFFYIHIIVKYFSNVYYKKALTLILTLFITFTTGVGLFSGKLMPDIFTPIIILSAYLLLLVKQISKTEKIIISIIFYYALMVHISHLMIIFMAVFFSCIYLIYKYRKNLIHSLSVFRKFYLIIFITLLSGLTIPTVNYFNYGQFEMTKGSHVFFMARLADSGILKKYLDENCKNENYSLCKYKDEIPTSAVGFLWNESSPFYKTGGWIDSKEEYNKLINAIFSDPRYWKFLFFDFTKQTFKQFFTFSPGTIISHRENTPPFWEIEGKMKHELNEYRNSTQFVQGYDISFLERRQLFLFYFSLIIIIVCVFTTYFYSANTFGVKGIVFLFLMLFINAFVCGALANVVDRLQGRVVWIIPVFAIIISVNYLAETKFPQLKKP
jgi:hypothetical protein